MLNGRAVDVAASAPQLEVRELVRPTAHERDAVVNLETLHPAAADAQAVAGVYLLAEAAPGPAACDPAPRRPVAGGLPMCSTGGAARAPRPLATIEARTLNAAAHKPLPPFRTPSLG